MGSFESIERRYKALKTLRQDVLSAKMREAEAQISHERADFSRLVWEAHKLEGRTIAEIARAMQGSRTSVYNILKEREDVSQAQGPIEGFVYAKHVIHVRWDALEFKYENFTFTDHEDRKQTIDIEGKVWWDDGWETSVNFLIGESKQYFDEIVDHALPQGLGKLIGQKIKELKSE